VAVLGSRAAETCARATSLTETKNLCKRSVDWSVKESGGRERREECAQGGKPFHREEGTPAYSRER
jgi:hypothetical protein